LCLTSFILVIIAVLVTVFIHHMDERRPRKARGDGSYKKRATLAYFDLFFGLAMLLFGIISVAFGFAGSTECSVYYGIFPLIIGPWRLIVSYKGYGIYKMMDTRV